MSNATMEMSPVATTNNEPKVKKAKATKVETPAVDVKPQIKQTPVEERKYELTEIGRNLTEKFRGKQRQIVFDVLKAATQPMTYSEVAREAEKLELKATGGVDLSCRYHLHHLTLENITTVVNPTINVAEDPTITK